MSTSHNDPLPAAGNTYRVDFGGGNAFEIAFDNAAAMTFTKLQEPNLGMVETIRYTHRKLRDGLYLVYWQEQDGTSVVHAQDFEEGRVYTHITSPDHRFYSGMSLLEKLR
ncbi:hypothetical protein DYQ93_07560 [Xanthomonas sp. LMG 8992]|uniref:MoaF-related domain-containing protein n=1 Tax=Xanthomonas sp. LMG 8992 TaxID=1591157 RepID=UPI001367F7D6|nr:hypothetical protein [Xanthomonas sp. LMG 8992]MXV10894.1 hypothetical protein [Xanthomonas sp. LMG 8992]